MEGLRRDRRGEGAKKSIMFERNSYLSTKDSDLKGVFLQKEDESDDERDDTTNKEAEVQADPLGEEQAEGATTIEIVVTCCFGSHCLGALFRTFSLLFDFLR
mmetsp:Transcript_29769/g.43875  ORF Transcript_29769/g.43875 Transcript_29769/m.43875 type:complete len:102 (-) Transcript_29769:936-1241(-)